MPTITIGRSGNGSGGSSRGGSGGSSGGSGSRDYPSGRDHGGGHSSGSRSESKSNESSYGLHNLKELPRIASETTFAATCHGSIAVNSIIDHAITRNSLGYGPYALASLTTLNLSHNYLSYKDAKTLNDGLYGYTLNLQVFNFCNNNIGAVGLDFLVKGSIGIDHLQKGGKDIHNMMQGILTLPTTSIVCLNLANNNIGDVGADILGHALANGKLPATKYIDVSGNGLERSHSGMDKMLQGIKNAKAHIVVVISKIQSGVSTTGKLVFGSKEEKQSIIKDTLQTAHDNGVDVNNIAVSKGILGFLDNLGYVISDFAIGFVKCNIVPESAGTFAADQIVARVSKKAHIANTSKDAALCFFSTIEEVATSPTGVNLIKDLDLVGVDVVIDSIQ